MKPLARCVNGHFFDNSVYPVCPYCNGGKEDSEPSHSKTLPIYNEDGPDTFVPTVPVTDNTTGNTVPPKNNPRDESVTTCVFKRRVVGWLVAIEGPHRETSYELHSGYNRVGRTEGDIQLSKDSSISRANHFRIVYDDEDNQFMFFAGGSDNYPRVNGVKMYDGERAILEPYAMIETGNTKFLFVPLCTDRFKWTDEPDKETHEHQ